MEQLILIGVIVLFSLLEAVARRQKRQRQGGAGAEAPPLPGEWEGEPRQERPPGPSYESYDQDPSFDDAVEEGGRDRIESDTALTRRPTEARTPTARSSEDLIPRDIWEEIAALARGEKPPATRRPPAPAKGPPLTVESPPGGERAPRGLEVRGPARGPARARTSHPVHDTHPNLGRPVSERLTSPARRMVGPPPSEDIKAVRRLLSGGGTSLRRAVILHEILGPPASQRGDPGDPTA